MRSRTLYRAGNESLRGQILHLSGVKGPSCQAQNFTSVRSKYNCSVQEECNRLGWERLKFVPAKADTLRLDMGTEHTHTRVVKELTVGKCRKGE